MTNVHYLRNQLTFALDAIRRGLDALEAEPDNSGPAGSCQCDDPTVICPVHPRGPRMDPSIGRDPPTREDLRAALAADGAAELPPAAPDPLARSMALAMAIQRIAALTQMVDEVHARVIRAEKILLDVNVDACMKHDLCPF